MAMIQGRGDDELQVRSAIVGQCSRESLESKEMESSKVRRCGELVFVIKEVWSDRGPKE